jgi:hypothetical protein
MRLLSNTIKALLLALALPVTLWAQDEKISYGRPTNWRPYDQTGINVFETKKDNSITSEGLRFRIGAGFTQQFQNLKHKNKGADNFEGANRLYPLASGFMTAQANLFMDVQLADGIRLNVTTYLSSRHHNEAWVKGGYIQFDKLPLKGKIWEDIMNVTTIKVGHMEINYGDAHFRRSDGGQTLYNPFMESYIMDAFATEIGGEVYVQKYGVFGMVGVTNGMMKGNVDSVAKTAVDDNTKRSPSLYFKGGFDQNISDGIRVRISGSYYQNVMEKAPAGASLPSSTGIAFSGRLNPGFTKKVDAYMINGFLKVHGLELFGTFENAKGRSKTETDNRRMYQYAGDLVYRFGWPENLFAGVRYNKVTGKLAGFTDDINVERYAAAGGWFITKNVLLKGEYVIQKYKSFPAADFRSTGKFNGYVIEAVVGF